MVIGCGLVTEEGEKVRDLDSPGEEMYDAYYYAHDCGRPYQRDEEWLSFFGKIADCIVSDFQPKTVLDAGCAMGFLVEKLRERNVSAFGIDISKYAIQEVHESVRPYCQVGSVTKSFPRHYDLIVNIEVLEHLTSFQAREAVKNLCRHTDQILFSSTPMDYQEVTHINVRPTSYWAALFAGKGFIRDVDYDASYVTPWAGLFRRVDISRPELVRNYERHWWLLQHENVELRKALAGFREKFKQLERESSTLRAETEHLERQATGLEGGRLMRMLMNIKNRLL